MIWYLQSSEEENNSNSETRGHCCLQEAIWIIQDNKWHWMFLVVRQESNEWSSQIDQQDK